MYPKTSSDSLPTYPQLFPCNLTSPTSSSLPSSAQTTTSGQPSSTSTSTSSRIFSTTDSNYEASTSTPASSHSHSTSTIASTTSSLGTTTTSPHWTFVSKITTSPLSSTSTSGYPASTATSSSRHISTATSSSRKMSTSTITTTRSVGYTSLSTTTGSYCRTSCPCQYSHKYNTTELEIAIESIIQNLTINKAETSKAKRQLTSAEDTRTSAQVVGGLGAALLSVVFGGILLCDLPRLFALGTKG